MKLLPPRHGWLRLVASPTSYMLTVAALVTVVVKAIIARKLENTPPYPLFATWAGAADLATYFAFAALFAVGEGRFRWVRAATWPLAALISGIGLVNAGYLYVSGEQLTFETVALGTARFADLWSISKEHLANFGWPRVVGLAAAVVGLPVLLGFVVRRRWGWDAHVDGRARGGCALAVAVLALVAALVLPRPADPAARRLGSNAALQTYWSWVTAPEPGEAKFAGYAEPRLVAPEDVARLAAGPRPSVVLVVWESTRFDHTSLAGPGAPAKTPNLLALAERGTRMMRARAVVPHTTKSLFTILCARYPVMQRAVVEVGGRFAPECLPAVLGEAGYKTGMVQSAHGSFEGRYRYAQVLGFKSFAAWEDIRGESLGYLASADGSLAEPIDIWLDRVKGGPFFLVVLTSATHHPYRLPEELEARAKLAGAPRDSNEERYSRLVEGEDELLGHILKALAARNLTESTLVAVMGDHGEGFGKRGVRQHDNDYFEEGLHVPLVIAGPGVAHGVIDDNVSLLDVSPTLLGRLGVKVLPGADGLDVLAGPIPARPHVFSCWEETRCRGFVMGSTKVVRIPETGEVFAYDLAADPDESRVVKVPAELEEVRKGVEETIDAHQAAPKDLAGW